MRRPTEGVAVSILIFHLAYLWLECAPLPATVPTHFGFTGADALGPKRDVWSTWFVSLGLYALLTGRTFIPLASPLCNLPTSFKQDTSGRAKRFVGEMMAWFKVLTAAIFLVISWATVRTAYGRAAEGLHRAGRGDAAAASYFGGVAKPHDQPRAREQSAMEPPVMTRGTDASTLSLEA